MLSTSLKHLLKEEKGIVCVPHGLLITVSPSWIIAGESRLSYTSIIRLVECCREHHWETDVESIVAGFSIDSITKSIECEFTKPIPVGSTFRLGYTITDVRSRSYSILFEAHDLSTEELCASISMVSIFYDPIAQAVTYPPEKIISSLNARRRVEDARP